jgi:hypothetical protein
MPLVDAEGFPERPGCFPVEIGYATVHKGRKRGRVVRVEPRIVFGTEGQAAEALDRGTTAATINTSYVKRFHGTNRRFNARKARKVYTFSMDLGFHVAVAWLCVGFYNVGWTPRTWGRKRPSDRPGRLRVLPVAVLRHLGLAVVMPIRIQPGDDVLQRQRAVLDGAGDLIGTFRGLALQLE